MRLLHALRTPRGLAVLTLITLVMLWIIVPSGAIVRLTGSGLGCPDWPLCEGRVVPATAGHAVIEYTNRCSRAWWSPRPSSLARRPMDAARPARLKAGPPVPPWQRRPSPLGAITVLTDLHPLAVGSHFLLSMVALACGVLAFRHARDWRAGRTRSWDLRRGPLAGAVLVAAGVVLVTGVIVTAAGPHPGDSEVVRRWGDLAELATVHVRAAFAFTALAVVLVAWISRERTVDRLTARLTAACLPLVALQIALGEIQYRNGLPWQVVVFHVSVAGLLWALMVGLCWGIARPEAPAPPTPDGETTPAAQALSAGG